MTPEDFARLSHGLDGPPAFRAVRAAAAERLLATGFPAPRDEAWKYTKAAPFLRAPYAPTAALTVGGFELPTGSGPDAVVFVDGWLDPTRTTAKARSIRDAEGATGRVLRDPSGFVALNLALARDGVYLHVAPERSEALQLVHLATGGTSLGAVRHVIEVGAGARLELVERYVGGGPAFTSAGVEIVLGEGAELVHVRVADEHADVVHHAAIGVEVGAGARYQLVSVVTGGSTTRIEPTVRFAGPGGTADLWGLVALRDAQHADHHVLVDHAAPRCTSRQTFRSLLDHRSRGIYTGKVVVRPGAAGTDSTQVHRALLLSDDAVANARPQLEIDADDVKCAHGAAVGSLDEEALFYLRQRGLDPIAARALLTAAFAKEIVDAIPVAAVREEVDGRIGRWLAS